MLTNNQPPSASTPFKVGRASRSRSGASHPGPNQRGWLGYGALYAALIAAVWCFGALSAHAAPIFEQTNTAPTFTFTLDEENQDDVSSETLTVINSGTISGARLYLGHTAATKLNPGSVPAIEVYLSKNTSPFTTCSLFQALDQAGTPEQYAQWNETLGSPDFYDVDLSEEVGFGACEGVTFNEGDEWTLGVTASWLSFPSEFSATFGGAFEGAYIWVDTDELPPPNPPTGQTRVLEIASPTAYEVFATTTPFSVEFEGFANASSTQPNAYEIQWKHVTTGETHIQRGYLLDDAGWIPADGTTFTVSTTSVPFVTEGTWYMSVFLGVGDTFGTVGGPGAITDFTSVGLPYTNWPFALIEHDATITTVYPPPAQTFAEETCDLELNPFATSTFHLADCIGYLFVPSPDPWSKYSLLTLDGRFPMSYVNQFSEVRENLYANEDTSNQAITVSILNGELTLLSRDMVAAVPFASLIREMLSAVIWFLLAYALYRMVLRMFDSHTPV